MDARARPAIAVRARNEPGRLAAGGMIDRERPLRFRFDGKAMGGFHGDTLASALIANGVRLIGRSFKYHRPRGILTAGIEEPNALVELGSGARREPNTKATVLELWEGLEAASQNRWPSLSFDLRSVNGLLSPLFVAGFYYKTFMWPPRFWERLYEPLIRRAAGLGRASGLPDPDAYDKAHDFCDVLVVGSGPAGLMAAQAAVEAGARVILCEQDFVYGGRLSSEDVQVDGRPGHEWCAHVIAALGASPRVRIMKRTAVFGAYDGSTYGALENLGGGRKEPGSHEPRQRYWKVVARRAVIATGATERMIAFGGNDRPGVMAGSAVRSYVRRFAAIPGRRAALFTCNDSGWTTLAPLREAGVEVATVIDTRGSADTRSGAPALARSRNVEVFQGAQVADVHGGRHGVRAIDIVTSSGRRRLEIDLLAVSGGWNPNAELATHRGARLSWSDEAHAFVCAQPPSDMHLAGSANARWTLADCLADGQRAGTLAAAELGLRSSPRAIPACSPESSGGESFWRSRGARGKSFVDFQHDVTTDDVELAAREGYDCPEHLKRYTTLGMATDQGRTSAVAGQGVLAGTLHRPLSTLGTTSPRPPAVPVAIAALAHRHRGKHYRPTRLAPTYEWSRANGAVFGVSGPWLRAKYFSRPEDSDAQASVNREVTATRAGVGICDVSTLGKIDVQGADAATFLDRVYANHISTLEVGRVRYGLLLREDGIVFDDGTVARPAPERFLLSTTTLHAEEVLRHIEYCHQVLWPALDVQITGVTDHWAQLAIAGPRSRDLLSRLIDPPFDISNARFPHLSTAELAICGGLGARLFRISFSGELAYELAVPARYGEALFLRLLSEGARFGVAPYGVEALNVMRVEKGYVGGAEINGQVTAGDLGLGRLLSTRKDYIGRVLAARPALRDIGRPTLVGLVPVDAGARFRAGAQLCALDDRHMPRTMEGYVTSAVHSPTVGGWIALALLARGPQRMNELIQVCDPLKGAQTRARVCAPVFFDPQGDRAHL